MDVGPYQGGWRYCSVLTYSVSSQIEPESDPRHSQDDEPPQPIPPQHPLHDHNPWDHQQSGSEDDGMRRVTWSSGPMGMRYTSTYFRTSPDVARHPGPPMDDPVLPIFHNFASMVQSIIGPVGVPNVRRDGTPGEVDPTSRRTAASSTRPNTGAPNAQSEGVNRQEFAGGNVYTATGRLWPRDANNAQPQMRPVDDLNGFVITGHHHTNEPLGLFPPDRLLSHLFQNLAPIGPGGAAGARGEGPDMLGGPMGGPFAMLARLLNPANAASGDAVYTQEALDRVISQLMEQHAGGNAPGPASTAAIESLPRRKVDETMLGDNGQAECSICMDNVEIGTEVTFLPCNHWFHGDCVGAWLREHDTCPHCRQGIMPKDGQGNTPRSPGQEPRNSQMPLSPGREGSRRNPFVIPESPGGGSYFHGQRGDGSPRRDFSRSEPAPPESRNRRSSPRGSRGAGDGNSGGGGITGWVRNRFGGGGN